MGLGRIGAHVAQRALAFGATVVAFDPYISDDVARGLNVELVDLDRLLACSDFVSLHSSLTPDTQGLINMFIKMETQFKQERRWWQAIPLSICHLPAMEKHRCREGKHAFLRR